MIVDLLMAFALGMICGIIVIFAIAACIVGRRRDDEGKGPWMI